MHETNPFVSPQHVAEPVTEAIGDPTRPKPWSVLSVLATLLMGGIVLLSQASTLLNHWPPLANLGRSGGDTILDVNIGLILVQTVILGFWVGVGSGPMVVRLVGSLVFVVGLCLEAALVDERPAIAAALGYLVAATTSAGLETFLLACRSQRSYREVAIACMRTIIPLVAAIGVIACDSVYQGLSPTWHIWLSFGAYGAMGVGIAVAGIFLLLRKHDLLSRGKLVGIVLFFLTPPAVGMMELLVDGHSHHAMELAIIVAIVQVTFFVLFHATQRIMRSYGGSYVPLALVTSEPGET
ncbi:hypothetical protein [Blastopirellula marina]|uniref:Uncharacterized protein n=1 Tax=Blastopirellula marina TaxID=124 RepID=A0A2S8FLE6_9BACT|nr:hypothetical protein [Blastopirellula marina]PQO33005.1 hypothetical protein C5Y98_17875 [Blastopirellula marina]PTL43172.1 hypothetical protein C5Y97_17885 [Blastopirellula marina]